MGSVNQILKLALAERKRLDKVIQYLTPKTSEKKVRRPRVVKSDEPLVTKGRKRKALGPQADSSVAAEA